MKERPIIFNTDMVEAILAGRKIQTRRVIMPQPQGMYQEQPAYLPTSSDGKTVVCFDAGASYSNGHSFGAFFAKCPYGTPGDHLWVREAFSRNRAGSLQYKAGADDAPWTPWKPSIHMPKSAARLWLKVIEVRAERLHDITEEDAKAEGVRFNLTQKQIDRTVGITGKPEDHGYRNYLWHGEPDVTDAQVEAWPHQFSSYSSARDSFSSLWEKINAKRGLGWGVNPWVWVVEFERMD